MIVSYRYQLIKEDMVKILSGLGIALVGAVLTYLSEVITQVDFGDWTPIITAIWAVVFNVVRKWLATTEYK